MIRIVSRISDSFLDSLQEDVNQTFHFRQAEVVFSSRMQLSHAFFRDFRPIADSGSDKRKWPACISTPFTPPDDGLRNMRPFTLPIKNSFRIS